MSQLASMGDGEGAIDQLPNSSTADRPPDKELLTQLQAAIEADSNLSLEDKAEAFEQVIVLAEAGKNPTKEIRQKFIRTAIKIVKGTIADLPDTSRLAQECDRLLPAIAKLYHNPGDTMTEDTQVVDLDTISADVTNAVNDLPASPPPDQEGIKELVERLQKMIEGDENLKPEDKAEALKQVQALAEAAKNPLVAEHKSVAESTINRLRGKMEEVPEAVNFTEACNSLLPQINTIFGLGN